MMQAGLPPTFVSNVVNVAATNAMDAWPASAATVDAPVIPPNMIVLDPRHHPPTAQVAHSHSRCYANHDEHESYSSWQNLQDNLQPARGIDFHSPIRPYSGFWLMLYYIFASLISAVLLLTAACPVPWYRASSNGRSAVWTLWRDDNKVRWTSVACQHKTQMFQAMAAYTILACVLCLATFVAGLCHLTGWGHYGVSLLLSFLAMFASLVAWALCVAQYHRYNCPGEMAYYDHVNRLNAGFSLTICAFGLMFFAFFGLVYYLFRYYALDQCTRCHFRKHALACACALAGCLLISVVGTAFTMWEGYFVGYTVKVRLWHVEVVDITNGLSEHWSITDYHCPDLAHRFRAGQAVIIVADVCLFATMLTAFGAVYRHLCKYFTLGLATVSWLLLLIFCVVMLTARYRDFCADGGTDVVLANGVRNAPSGTAVRQRVHYEGYVITEGLGMIISAWCAIPFILYYLCIKG